ncbi:glycogen/starch synthase [Halomonas sp. PR-M31]|uniref:glycogen/starch synthase n=1 Tax=Halomonas sp. PR-M31 TaxID=1471202 RepID=UPI000B01B4F6|nr:glycogen/starch synthase [Halomonas sp. PR-M31]
MGNTALRSISQEMVPVDVDTDDPLVKDQQKIALPAVIEKAARARTIPRRIEKKDESRYDVLYVTPEIADLVKVGGLGDVSSALPRALRLRHDVRVLLPAYREVIQSDRKIEVVGHLPALADIPACDIGQITYPDG